MSDFQMVELLAPPGVTKAVTIRVKITPPTGSVLIYGAPGYNKPIKFHGPQQVGSIATNSPIGKVEMVDGATAWEIETMGYQIDR